MSLEAMSRVWRMQLDPSKKLVLLSIADCADDDFACFPSVTHIARKCCMPDRSVRRHLSALESDGILTRESRDGRSNIYVLRLTHPCHGVTPDTVSPLTPCQPPPDTMSAITQIEPKYININNARTRKTSSTKPKKHSVTEWAGPSERVSNLMQQEGIDEEFGAALVEPFRMYWEERGDKRPGWDATFWNHVKAQWDRRPRQASPTATNQRGNYDHSYKQPQDDYITARLRELKRARSGNGPMDAIEGDFSVNVEALGNAPAGYRGRA